MQHHCAPSVCISEAQTFDFPTNDMLNPPLCMSEPQRASLQCGLRQNWSLPYYTNSAQGLVYLPGSSSATLHGIDTNSVTLPFGQGCQWSSFESTWSTSSWYVQ